MSEWHYNNLLTIPTASLQAAVAGGVMISLASSLYYILFGSILGMSGLVGSQLTSPLQASSRNKSLILLGMLIASLLSGLAGLDAFDRLHPAHYQSGRLLVSGLLVGVGTDLGSGCTSGHGLCGLPRFSLRSFVAVLVFLTTGILTATLELRQYINIDVSINGVNSIGMGANTLLIGISAATLFVFYWNKSPVLSKVALLAIGMLFGAGLMVAGMTQRHKIYGFLQLNHEWDPSLLFVLMTGVMLNLVAFSMMRLKIRKSVFGGVVEDNHGSVTGKLVGGAFLFGVGWGLGGLCPGPFLLTIVQSSQIAIYWGIPFAIGKILSSNLGAKKQVKKE